MEKQLDNRIVGKDIPYERFPAVHGRVLLDPANADGAALREFVAEHGYRPRVVEQGVEAFVVGVLMSHLGVWQKIADDHPSGVYMIVEDDVKFKLGWQKWLQTALDGLKAHNVEWEMLKLLNVAHHNVSGYETALHKHPLVVCGEDKNGKKGCSLKTHRIEKSITTVCVKKQCERILKLAPGDDGRNLGMQGYLIRKKGGNLQAMIATVKRRLKQGKIVHIDEILNEAVMEEHGVYFLSANGGADEGHQGPSQPKVISVGIISHESSIHNGKSGKSTEYTTGVKFERTTET
jgi:GR25 family glycosyltransferase involved in LPS biosynthesis